ncbi:MAG: rhodanese-like domain-containing protein [Dehalobacterium sp.]
MLTEICSKELQTLMQSSELYALIDVRERTEYNRGQILGATNVPRRELELRMPRLVPLLSTRIVLYDDDGKRAYLALNTLKKNGYTYVQVLKGGLNAWKEAGCKLVEGVNVPSKTFGEVIASRHNINELTPNELKNSLDSGEELIVVEVRPPEEVEHSGSIPGAINIQGVQLPLVINDLAAKGKKIVVTCAGRTRGIIAALTSYMMDIEVFDLRNGTQGWVLGGFDLQEDIPQGPKPSSKSKQQAEQFVTRLMETHNFSLVLAEKLETLKQEKPYFYLFDVRTKEEYASGHVPGSISLPGGQAIQCADDFIAIRNSTIVFICDDMIRSVITAYWFMQMGYKNVHVLSGGINAWLESSLELESGEGNVLPMGFEEAWNKVQKIDTFTLNRQIQDNSKIYLIYVDDSHKFKDGHIKGSIWLLRSFLEQRIESIVSKKDMPIVLTCSDGINSILAASTLMDLGYEDIQVLNGGIKAWQSAGFALESGYSGIIDDPDDILPKSHERTREQMVKYLSWEEKLYGDPVYMKILTF